MTCYYTDTPGATQTTNAAANTENDCFFLAVGATRNLYLMGLFPHGANAGQTQITATGYRVKKWTTTASSGGTAITPRPVDPGYQAAKHTAGFAVGAVTPGTGGPTLLASIGTGSTSPNGMIWAQGSNLDQCPLLEAAATQSLDVFSVSGGVSQIFELYTTSAE